MEGNLNRREVAERVREATSSLPRDECRTCDCFQGFLVQLELDFGEDVADIVSAWRIGRESMHGCLGCDPCPPGSAFAEYLKQERKK
jgi:hypothetical protein